MVVASIALLQDTIFARALALALALARPRTRARARARALTLLQDTIFVATVVAIDKLSVGAGAALAFALETISVTLT